MKILKISMTIQREVKAAKLEAVKPILKKARQIIIKETECATITINLAAKNSNNNSSKDHRAAEIVTMARKEENGTDERQVKSRDDSIVGVVKRTGPKDRLTSTKR